MTTSGPVSVVLVLGWYSWPAVGGAAALGFAITWPLIYAVSRRIKRQDPNWDATKIEWVEGVNSDPAAPEV